MMYRILVKQWDQPVMEVGRYNTEEECDDILDGIRLVLMNKESTWIALNNLMLPINTITYINKEKVEETYDRLS